MLRTSAGARCWRSPPSTLAYFLVFPARARGPRAPRRGADVERPDETRAGGPALLPVPAWVTAVHVAFMAWTVVTAHYPVLFVGGFLFFLGFAKATAAYQSRMELRRRCWSDSFSAGW